jgi:hypothetical protein
MSLLEQGAMAERILPDGTSLGVWRMMFTFRLTVARDGCEWGYDTSYCYHTDEAAISAMNEWDGTGDPEGWHRNPETGRRRPDGDPSREYVDF